MPESADNQKPTLVSMEESSCVDLSEVDLICADMDGTLVSPFHTIPDVTLNAIIRADQNGCNNVIP